MKKYITEPQVDQLLFMIAAYEEKMVYHDIEDNKLSAGQSLTKESIKHIFRFVNNVENDTDYQFKGFIPDNILRYSTEEKYVAWYTKKQTQMLYYKDGLQVKSGSYPIPALIWILQDNELTMFAVKSNPKRGRLKLYNAPFFNTLSNGAICMGSAKFKSDEYDYESIIKKAESGFFTSVFTHTNNNELLKGNFIELSAAMLDSKIPFDDNLLVESHIKNIFR